MELFNRLRKNNLFHCINLNVFLSLGIIPIGLFVLKILSLFLFPDVDGMEVKL